MASPQAVVFAAFDLVKENRNLGVLAGFNQVWRSVTRNEASLVIVADDVIPDDFCDGLRAKAQFAGIPVVTALSRVSLGILTLGPGCETTAVSLGGGPGFIPTVTAALAAALADAPE